MRPDLGAWVRRVVRAPPLTNGSVAFVNVTLGLHVDSLSTRHLRNITSQRVYQGCGLKRAENLSEGATLQVSRVMPRMEQVQKPTRLRRE